MTDRLSSSRTLSTEQLSLHTVATGVSESTSDDQVFNRTFDFDMLQPTVRSH
jgi:hypothetical protein